MRGKERRGGNKNGEKCRQWHTTSPGRAQDLAGARKTTGEATVGTREGMLGWEKRSTKKHSCGAPT